MPRKEKKKQRSIQRLNEQSDRMWNEAVQLFGNASKSNGIEKVGTSTTARTLDKVTNALLPGAFRNGKHKGLFGRQKAAKKEEYEETIASLKQRLHDLQVEAARDRAEVEGTMMQLKSTEEESAKKSQIIEKLSKKQVQNSHPRSKPVSNFAAQDAENLSSLGNGAMDDIRTRVQQLSGELGAVDKVGNVVMKTEAEEQAYGLSESTSSHDDCRLCDSYQKQISELSTVLEELRDGNTKLECKLQMREALITELQGELDNAEKGGANTELNQVKGAQSVLEPEKVIPGLEKLEVEITKLSKTIQLEREKVTKDIEVTSDKLSHYRRLKENRQKDARSFEERLKDLRKQLNPEPLTPRTEPAISPQALVSRSYGRRSGSGPKSVTFSPIAGEMVISSPDTGLAREEGGESDNIHHHRDYTVDLKSGAGAAADVATSTAPKSWTGGYTDTKTKTTTPTTTIGTGQPGSRRTPDKAQRSLSFNYDPEPPLPLYDDHSRFLSFNNDRSEKLQNSPFTARTTTRSNFFRHPSSWIKRATRTPPTQENEE